MAPIPIPAPHHPVDEDCLEPGTVKSPAWATLVGPPCGLLTAEVVVRLEDADVGDADVGFALAPSTVSPAWGSVAVRPGGSTASN